MGGLRANQFKRHQASLAYPDDKVWSMTNNAFTPPSAGTIQTEGNTLQVVGLVAAGIGLAISVLIIIVGGSALVHLILPVGLLTAAVGYLKQIAAATAGLYVLNLNEVTEEDIPHE